MFNGRKIAISAGICALLLLIAALLYTIPGWKQAARIASIFVSIVCFAVSIYKLVRWHWEDYKAFPKTQRDPRRCAPAYRDGYPESNSLAAEVYIWVAGSIISLIILSSIGFQREGKTLSHMKPTILISKKHWRTDGSPVFFCFAPDQPRTVVVLATHMAVTTTALMMPPT